MPLYYENAAIGECVVASVYLLGYHMPWAGLDIRCGSKFIARAGLQMSCRSRCRCRVLVCSILYWYNHTVLVKVSIANNYAEGGATEAYCSLFVCVCACVRACVCVGALVVCW